MSITSALVLLAIIWWLTFLLVLPFKVKTQGESGKIEPGTHAGSPQVHNLPQKALTTSVIALVLWGLLCAIILSGAVPVTEMEFFRFEKQIYDGTNG